MIIKSAKVIREYMEKPYPAIVARTHVMRNGNIYDHILLRVDPKHAHRRVTRSLENGELLLNVEGFAIPVECVYSLNFPPPSDRFIEIIEPIYTQHGFLGRACDIVPDLWQSRRTLIYKQYSRRAVSYEKQTVGYVDELANRERYYGHACLVNCNTMEIIEEVLMDNDEFEWSDCDAIQPGMNFVARGYVSDNIGARCTFIMVDDNLKPLINIINSWHLNYIRCDGSKIVEIEDGQKTIYKEGYWYPNIPKEE